MRPFRYSNAKDIPSAIKLVADNPNARFLAGGTNLLDLMKEGVERPDELIDITRLELAQIKATGSGGISIGGSGRNTMRRTICSSGSITHCWHRRYWLVLRGRSGIWRPMVETCFKGRAALISMMWQCPVTNASRVRVAVRWRVGESVHRHGAG